MSAPGRTSEGDVARSEGETVDALVGDDLVALGALYRRHGSLAYGLAVRMTGDATRAEVVVQSAFMALWNDRAQSDGGIDAVRLRLVQLVARASLVDIRRQGPLPIPGAIDPRAGFAMTKPFPGLPQGG